jgi:hypothetical protein
MKIRILIILTTILYSCTEKKTNITEKTDSLKIANNSINTDIKTKLVDCKAWLDYDTVLSTGAFIRYIIKENGKVKIEWGNNTFKRTLKNEYDCEGAPNWIPTLRWSTSKNIGLKYGCGSSCWGTIILPINNNDSIIERMNDFLIDTLGNRTVYLDNTTYDKLVVENYETGDKKNIDFKFECKAAFIGFCMDTIILNKHLLTIKWVDWTNNGKKKIIKTEKFEL